MKCAQMATSVGCFTDGAGVKKTVTIHYEYGKNAAGGTIIAATRYTDAEGLPIDTSAGFVAAGACAVAAPDVEWLPLCDVQANGTVVEFYRRTITSFASDGTPTVAVASFAADMTTVYVPAGTVGACDQDCDPATVQGVLTTWG